MIWVTRAIYGMSKFCCKICTPVPPLKHEYFLAQNSKNMLLQVMITVGFYVCAQKYDGPEGSLVLCGKFILCERIMYCAREIYSVRENYVLRERNLPCTRESCTAREKFLMWEKFALCERIFSVRERNLLLRERKIIFL